jgi:hypothetical protein
MQKCCYGVGRVWIRCGYGEARSGLPGAACSGAWSNQIASCPAGYLGRMESAEGERENWGGGGHRIPVR